MSDDYSSELEAALRVSKLAELDRQEEDEGAEALIKGYSKDHGVKTFNPPRDGDCLMRCAVEKYSKPAGGRGGGQGALTLTVNELRFAVVARGMERDLAALPSRTGSSAAKVEAHYKTMAQPGVVMGEAELQALADVLGVRVEVRI